MIGEAVLVSTVTDRRTPIGAGQGGSRHGPCSTEYARETRGIEAGAATLAFIANRNQGFILQEMSDELQTRGSEEWH